MIVLSQTNHENIVYLAVGMATDQNLQKKIETFFSQFPRSTFKKGDMILQPDEKPAGVYFLKTGNVRSYALSLEGYEVTIHIFFPNSFFPMMWLLEAVPNRYYLEATGPVEVYIAPEKKVMEFIEKNPDVARDVLKRMVLGLDRITQRIELLSFGKARTRVIAALIYMARHFGTTSEGTVHIREKFTHKDIAAFAGMSRETASREWEKLEKQKKIRIKDHSIIIDDIQSLKDELEG